MIAELLIVLVLTVINGLLAMSELAVVSARPARLRVMEADGNRGAGVALRLADNPGRFLSSVQIGITLVGILAGAFSGATLGSRLAEFLKLRGLADTIADPAGVGIVVVLITYMSLIVGELVPKQIALRDPERVAALVAPTMAFIASVAAPVVWLLDVSGKLVLRLIGQGGKAEETVTDEEVKTILAEAESAGVLETDEKAMINAVMRLADRSARALMTPRRDVELIDLGDTPDEILARIRATKRSALPVQDGDADQIIGVVVLKDLVDPLLDGNAPDVRSLVRQAPVVMDRADALHVLRAIRDSVVHIALVFDEYGHFEGIVTAGDVLEAIAGSFREEGDDEPAFVTREDGSFLVAGWMPVDEFAERLGVSIPKDAKYETVAGFVLDELERLPLVGETFVRAPWKFEVVDMDGRRVDKVLMSRVG